MGRKPVGDAAMTAAERQRRRRQAPCQIVVSMGGAWKLSQRRYEQLVAAVKAGEDYDLDRLGTFLGTAVNVLSI